MSVFCNGIVDKPCDCTTVAKNSIKRPSNWTRPCLSKVFSRVFRLVLDPGEVPVLKDIPRTPIVEDIENLEEHCLTNIVR